MFLSEELNIEQLMAAYEDHNGRTLFECIDQQPESVPELNGHDEGGTVAMLTTTTWRQPATVSPVLPMTLRRR